jgi:cytochrome c oxidase subunit 1
MRQQRHIDTQHAMPRLYALGFVLIFVIGWLSYIFRSWMPVGPPTYGGYHVGHTYYLQFGGLLFAGFAGISYVYQKIFGRMMNPTLGLIHCFITFLAYNGIFFNMHIRSVGGHMRRIYDPYTSSHWVDFLAHPQTVNTFESVSAIVLLLVQLIFVFNIIYSLFKGEKAGNNPWLSVSLE